MTTEELYKEIETAHEAYSTLFFKYVTCGDTINTKCYKRMCDSQRKIIEELVKMYWDSKTEDIYD
jgi:hypothetical protein